MSPCSMPTQILTCVDFLVNVSVFFFFWFYEHTKFAFSCAIYVDLTILHAKLSQISYENKNLASALSEKI